ncbi:hypothetical protein VTK73DRAFT_7508 [Phialemonium thermophilum]|uniref:Allantoate permease of the major facilitator superfamily n=1 Tax=Phialemonium thermophilum TaxID=223376 RepID=A0ABR3WE87_9PEZI
MTEKHQRDEPVPIESLPPRRLDSADDKKHDRSLSPGITEQDEEHVFALKDVDDTTVFYNLNKNSVGELTPETEAKLASTMGIFRDVDMTKNEYNNLFVVFYTGYLIALWPGAWVQQRVGLRYFITGSLFLWAFLLGMHPLVKTGKQLMALRFFLGMTESQIVPSTTVIHQAFFPPKKSPWVQLLWWASGSFANVLLTMVAYKLIVDENVGVLVGGISSWKWLHIICVVLTFCVMLPLLIFLPNSPVDAKWLNTEEKVHTIAIIRREHAGISNSTWKWSQVRECFVDLKSWLFILHMFFNELPNNTSQQLPLIVVGFGFTAAESALFNIAKPLIGSALILVSAAMLYGTRLGTGYTCAISYIPCFVGGIIELAAPWDNKIALVVGTQISTFKPSYLLGLSWAGTTTTGYTKKLCLLSSCVVAASVANMISPEFWQEKYKPRYVLPWSFMTAFWFISPGMCLLIRFHLVRENRKRRVLLDQREGIEENDVVETGSQRLYIDDDDLDKTDRQNVKFIYPL